MDGNRTLADVFQARVARTPDREAYREYDPATSRWRSHTWRQTGERVQHFAQALARAGIGHGDRIGVLLPNGMAAVCVDQAALSRACVPAPMHALDNPASIGYILADSGASMLFAATRGQWEAVAALAIHLPALKWVVVQDAVASGKSPGQGPDGAVARGLAGRRCG